jgi:SNF2 family DNA or RNA helicase
MDRLAEAQRPVVRLRDQWTVIDPELLRKARDRQLKPLTGMDALSAALTGRTEVDGETVEVAANGWLDELRKRIADADGGAETLRQPAALSATLRDYQLRGLRWLARMTDLGLGGCLADDMGLGKTITLISLHLHRQDDKATAGPTLVVCPASLLGNWEREIERFAPGTPVHRFHGPTRTLDHISPDGPDSPNHPGFVLTTYGTMRLDAARLASVDWGLLVADEAQHIKNPLSGTAKELRRIPARGRVALTGTPVENNLTELWAILDWTTPGLLGTRSAFRNRWAKPIEADRDSYAAERLAVLVRPFLLRRRKSDPGIAPELPPKTETDHPVALTIEQAGLYEAVVREIMSQIGEAEGMARRGLIVKLLTGLKQICNHPAQYLKESKPRLDGRSGKLELLDELLDTILAEDGSVLVFTQYVAMARLLEAHLAGRGIGSQLLHGGTPVAHREQMVRDFQDGAAPVFLLSLKAAGTGLNLTRADHVVHFDRWWNPAVEDQATDRAHRIGQTRPVQVHRLIAEGTVEDRIAAMLAEKRALADAVLSGGEAALTELSDAELANLVELRSA